MSYYEYILDQEIIDRELKNEKKEASTLKRFINFIVDYFVGGTLLGIVVGIILGLALTFTGRQELIIAYQYSMVAKLAMTIILLIGYYTVCEYCFGGKTLGKVVTRTRVISKDGAPLTIGQIFRRSCARFIPFETLSFFMGHSATASKGWHDRLSGTLVVEEA